MKYGVPINQIPKARRAAFVADPGKIMIGADYRAGESHIVSYVSGDERYIEAHEGPLDTHTYVSKLTYPELDWPDDPKEARKLAETYKKKEWKKVLRDLSKITQHGSNLGGSPYALAVNSGLPVKVMEDAQNRYFTAFPGIRRWQKFIRSELKAEKEIIIPGFGFGRLFFERPWSEKTWKEALAFVPQAFLALYCHQAMNHIWFDLESQWCHFLIHNHDQLVYQVAKDSVSQYTTEIRQRMEWPIDVPDFTGTTRRLVLRTDLKVGPNWKKVS